MRVMLIIISCVFCLSGQAQNEQKYWLAFAEEAMEVGDYFGAARYYKKSLSADPGEIELMYKYAEALRLSNNYVDAEEWYLRVYRKDKGRYFANGPYWIAYLKEANGDYEAAASYWDKVMHNEARSSTKYKRAQQRITSCQWAMEQEKKEYSGHIEVSNIGEGINSPESEFGVHLLKDSTLVFASLRGDYNVNEELKDTMNYSIKLYAAPVDNSSEPVLLDSIWALTDERIANASFNKAETELYFSMCAPAGDCAIYHAFSNEQGIYDIQKLEQKINAPASSTTMPHFAEFEDKRVLFFSSDRMTGQGGMDIYFSELTAEGFSTAQNLGPEINSLDNEISPFYNQKSGELYFSSDWHKGFGLMDIFKATGNVYHGFKDVENMGRPFNSSVNDIYFQMTPDSTGFLTSNRKGSYSLKGETCCNDIYYFNTQTEQDLATIEKDSVPVTQSIEVIDASSPLPDAVTSIDELEKYLPITLYFHNDRPNPKTTQSNTTVAYEETYSEYISLQSTYEEQVAQGLSYPVGVGERNLIRNFFEEMEREYERLDKISALLLSELEKGKTIELVIKGYASPLAQSDYNKYLTERRIQSLVNQLERWNNGSLARFINSSSSEAGKLLIERIPFGENKADSDVSDQQQDQRNSVYSAGAARERRIEILKISEK